ncbi:TetR/AcrR family transcriptional regulator [Planktotalea frisia]|nr:TetR/AcrR family transcriptional regulator [Planktotalea frisia]
MSEDNLNEDKPRVRGPGRTSREDWIQIALDTLISEGVGSVKVLVLAQKLDCARSSFYWYFKNRTDLLDSLLDHWQMTNTRALVSSANKPASSVNVALTNVFSSWVSGGEFDTQLDFAIREWARRSGTVRRAVDISDAARIDALAGMFLRFNFANGEAEVRARIVYFTQIGYDALDQQENADIRRSRARDTLFCMTGKLPTDAEVDALKNLPMAPR